MQQIQMRERSTRRDRARHSVARFQQRPIKTFPIESDEHRTLFHAARQFEQEGVLLIEVPHEELLDLQAARIPPGQTHQKCVGARATRQARGFGIQKEPLLRISHRFEKRAFNVHALRKQERQGPRVGRAHFRCGIPFPQR